MQHQEIEKGYECQAFRATSCMEPVCDRTLALSNAVYTPACSVCGPRLQIGGQLRVDGQDEQLRHALAQVLDALLCMPDPDVQVLVLQVNPGLTIACAGKL